MAKRSATWGVGFCIAAVLLVNGAVVSARTGQTEDVAGDSRSARLASLASSELENQSETATTLTPVSGTPGPSGTTPTDRTTTTRRANTAPATTTTTSRPAPATSTTLAGEPEGFRGSGLYVANPDGTGVRRLVPGYGMFTWSPDGTMVAYSRGDDLFIARADGSGRTILPAGKGALAPAWSPDGTRIAFTRSGGGAYLVPTDGSGPATLLDPAGQLVGWTPGGEVIVIIPPSAGLASVVAFDRRGGRRVLATDGSTTVQPEPSPDGRLVAYLGNGIRVAAVDGSGSRALTEICCGDESVGSPLAWSPDGRLLAYLHQGDVRVVGSDGSGDRVLAADAWAPTWSPDGRQLAFAGGSATRADGFLFSTLQVMPAGGGARKTIVDGAPKLAVLAPQWSPTGRQLAFLMSAGEPLPF